MIILMTSDELSEYIKRYHLAAEFDKDYALNNYINDDIVKDITFNIVMDREHVNLDLYETNKFLDVVYLQRYILNKYIESLNKVLYYYYKIFEKSKDFLVNLSLNPKYNIVLDKINLILDNFCNKLNNEFNPKNSKIYDFYSKKEIYPETDSLSRSYSSILYEIMWFYRASENLNFNNKFPSNIYDNNHVNHITIIALIKLALNKDEIKKLLD